VLRPVMATFCCLFVAGAVSQFVNKDNFLLVADGNEIVQVDSKTMNEYRLSIINVTSQPQVLAYDWLNQDVYWTSAVNTSTIFKYSFVSRTMSVVYVDSTSRNCTIVAVVLVVQT